nr:hypothetical protein [Candidatus Sigynarchaeota archaeon]
MNEIFVFHFFVEEPEFIPTKAEFEDVIRLMNTHGITAVAYPSEALSKKAVAALISAGFSTMVDAEAPGDQGKGLKVRAVLESTEVPERFRSSWLKIQAHDWKNVKQNDYFSVKLPVNKAMRDLISPAEKEREKRESIITWRSGFTDFGIKTSIFDYRRLGEDDDPFAPYEQRQLTSSYIVLSSVWQGVVPAEDLIDSFESDNGAFMDAVEDRLGRTLASCIDKSYT